MILGYCFLYFLTSDLQMIYVHVFSKRRCAKNKYDKHCINLTHLSKCTYIYRMEGDLIHIKMHHGGSFSMEGPLTYDGGEVSIFRDCDSERISYFRLVRMAKDVGFKDGDELFYSVPECSLDDGIDLLHDDNSVLKMVNFAKKHNFAEIYVKHKGSESIVVNQRSGAGSKEKLAEEVLYYKNDLFYMHY